MYTIYSAKKKQYLVKEEDTDFVYFNFTYDPSSATTFETQEEATTIRNEVVTGAQEQLVGFNIQTHLDVAEQESLTEFLTLTIKEV